MSQVTARLKRLVTTREAKRERGKAGGSLREGGGKGRTYLKCQMGEGKFIISAD